jgi:ankyrin repeat protein
MLWQQDVVVCVLFPYFIPSLFGRKQDCWLKKDFRPVLEYLLMLLCNTSVEKTEQALATFVQRTFLIPLSRRRYLNYDIEFLADIEERSSFNKAFGWTCKLHSLYACSVLIEHKANVNGKDDIALQFASRNGHTDTVVLLLEHKANVHGCDDVALEEATENGHIDTVAALLKYEANVHANGSLTLQVASQKGYKDIVVLLLEYKADVRANRSALTLAHRNGHKDIVALLIKNKY